jgi:hypothetical protein
MVEKRKPIRKKVLPASAPKRQNTKPRKDLPAHIPQPKKDFTKQSKILRNQAATDFIVDDQGRSIRWHYERTDRLYSKVIAYRTFEQWANIDKWSERRVEFWQQMEQRVIAHYADKVFRQRLVEMSKLEELIDVYEPYLLPMRDPKTDEVIIDKETNLPKFALKMPNLDKFAEMYLKIHERLMLLRGEAINRSDSVDKDRRVTAHTEDPVSSSVSINRSEARILAAALLEDRRAKGMLAPKIEVREDDDDSIPTE